MGRIKEQLKARRKERAVRKHNQKTMIEEIQWTPKQTDVLLSDADKIIMSGGYGSGKTRLGLYKFFSMIKKHPMDAMCLGFSAETMRKRLREYFSRESDEPIVISKNANEFHYNGAVVHIFGSDSVNQASRIRSLNLSYLYCDEPTTVGFLQSGYLEALSRIREGSPKIIITTNPSSPDHWVKTDIVDNPQFTHFSFSTLDNPYLKPNPKEYIKTMGIPEDTARYRQYILGEWVTSDDILFRIEDDVLSEDEPLKESFMWVDPSYSMNGDYTGVVVGCRYQTSKLLVKGYLFRNISFFYSKCEGIIKKHGVKQIWYDASLDYGYSLPDKIHQIFAQDGSIRVIPFPHEKENKEIKIITQINWALSLENLFISRNSDAAFMSQLKSYIGENSDYDDAPDALACLIRKLREVKFFKIN